MIGQLTAVCLYLRRSHEAVFSLACAGILVKTSVKTALISARTLSFSLSDG